MTQADTRFTGSIPEIYARYLGPLWFAPYAADVAARATRLAPRRILETAAGTGVVTRALAAALPDAAIDATDINQAMVTFAAANETQPGVRWSTADAMALPFEDERFDLVVCQFGIMFFPDRVTAFREARRVLTPSGTYLANVWDDLAHNDVGRIITDVACAAFPDDPPRFFERTPYGHGDPVAIERDLRTAGFRTVTWEPVEKRSRAAAARDAAVGACEGTPLRHEIVARDPNRLTDVIEDATQALRTAFGGDAIDGAMRAFVFTARKD